MAFDRPSATRIAGLLLTVAEVVDLVLHRGASGISHGGNASAERGLSALSALFRTRFWTPEGLYPAGGTVVATAGGTVVAIVGGTVGAMVGAIVGATVVVGTVVVLAMESPCFGVVITVTPSAMTN